MYSLPGPASPPTVRILMQAGCNSIGPILHSGQYLMSRKSPTAHILARAPERLPEQEACATKLLRDCLPKSSWPRPKRFVVRIMVVYAKAEADVNLMTNIS